MRLFSCLLICWLTTVSLSAQEVMTLADWEKQRDVLRGRWLEFLGPLVSARKTGDEVSPPKFEILEETQLDGFTRMKIRYETEPGTKTPAFLLVPDESSERRPAVVVFHTTDKTSYHQPAGTLAVTEKSFGDRLVRKGYVVLCPQNFLYTGSDERQVHPLEKPAKEFLQRRPNDKGMARMLLDGQIAVDLLVSLPSVDSKRIGCLGHSLGAKQVLYLMAFDDRVACGVSSEGGVDIDQSNWEAIWYLGAEVKKPDFPLHHRELVALIAPRPFLLIGGDASDGEASRPTIESAIPVYRLYGKPENIKLLNHRKGHSVPPETLEAIDRWLGERGRESRCVSSPAL